MTKEKKESKKESKETTKKTDPLDTIIPDPGKTIKNLEINASYVTNLQQVLVLILSTAIDADQVTNFYIKMNILDKAISEETEYEGERFDNFDVCVYTIIKLVTYLRSEVIKQKAYTEFPGQINKDKYGAELKSLLNAAPEDIDEEMNKLATKMADALGVDKPTVD